MRNLVLKIASSCLFTTLFPMLTVTASSNGERGTDFSTELGSEIGTDLSTGNTSSLLQGNPIWDIVKVLVGLAVVVTLLMFTVRWLSRRNRTWSSQRGLRSLGGIRLGQNSSLQVVEFSDRVYIIGVGESITLLDKETDPEQVALILQSLEYQDQGAMNLTAFKQLFASRNKTNKPSNIDTRSTESWDDVGAFEDLLQSKLERQAERKQQLESILKDKK